MFYIAICGKNAYMAAGFNGFFVLELISNLVTNMQLSEQNLISDSRSWIQLDRINSLTMFHHATRSHSSLPQQ